MTQLKKGAAPSLDKKKSMTRKDRDMGELNTKNRVKKFKKRIKHYSKSHKILLVGEGDFSFSACLATTFGSATNIVATSLDSKELLLKKYGKVRRNLKELKDLGCCIVHEVDASVMSQHPRLQHKSFDRIVFNFPHAGFQYREETTQQIKLHRNVVRGFLKNAKEMLSENGEIHITHKTAYPFSKWNIENLANKVGLILTEEAKFHQSDYPGYENKRGNGVDSDGTFPVGECSTFKFKKAFSLQDVIDSIISALAESHIYV